jgi:hypothetical protein
MKKKSDISVRSDEDLLRERTELLKEYVDISNRHKTISSRLAQIKSELAFRRKTRDKPFITDHAVIRYLERIHGLDIEAVRSSIETRIPVNPEVLDSNSVKIDNFVVKLSADRRAVTTVLTEDMLDEGALQEDISTSTDKK